MSTKGTVKTWCARHFSDRPSSGTVRGVAETIERQPATTLPHSLGFSDGQVVQEFGWDSDVDEDLRDAVMDATGEDLEDEEFTALSDGALVWWRADDGDSDDLADLFMDATSNLDEGGVIWVLTPKAGRPNHVETRDVEEAAKTAGLNPTSTAVVAPDWAGTRIVTKAKR